VYRQQELLKAKETGAVAKAVAIAKRHIKNQFNMKQAAAEKTLW